MVCTNLFIGSILVILSLQTILGSLPKRYKGTTPDLREIIIGRCWDYQRLTIENPYENEDLRVDVDCDEVWKVLNETLAYKDPCKITTKSYDKFFNLIDNGKDLKDQVMFWTNTRIVAHEFTFINPKYRTLEDTFAGYIANNLYWCTCPECGTGYNTEKKCDTNKTCDPNYVYWKRASKNLAEKASGIVHVMMNGTTKVNNTAYFRGSFFGQDELPTMAKLGKVKEMILYNVYSLNTNIQREVCGKDTFAELEEDANSMNSTGKITCKNDPRDVRFILCAKYPNAPECKFSNEVSASIKLTMTLHLLLVAIFVAISF